MSWLKKLRSLLDKEFCGSKSSQDTRIVNPKDAFPDPIERLEYRPGSEQGNTFLNPTSCHFSRNSCFDRLL